LKTAAELKRGESGVILQFQDQRWAAQLLGLGCQPGERISMVRSAPFGGPFYMRVNGSQFALRREEAINLVLDEHE